MEEKMYLQTLKWFERDIPTGKLKLHIKMTWGGGGGRKEGIIEISHLLFKGMWNRI
jgi:hypothetical protein